MIDVVNGETSFELVYFLIVNCKVNEALKKLLGGYLGLVVSLGEVQVKHLAKKGAVDANHVFYVLHKILF